MESKKFVQAILVLTSHMACDIKKDETVHATLHACDDDEATKNLIKVVEDESFSL